MRSSLAYLSSTSFMMAIFLAMSAASLALTLSHTSLMLFYEILTSSSAQLSLIFLMDPLSSSFLALVSLISLCASIFTQEYMSSDTWKKRFSVFLSGFVLSMAMLIMVPNLVTLLLGWDGLGLTSFILVLHYNNHSSMGAALITALTNRVGDALILISIGLTSFWGHWDIFLGLPLEKVTWALLIIAACTKSAQFPFSAWLPQAMAAPTPVSALVHSSTLVTAGIYLMIRLTLSSPLPQTVANPLALVAAATSAMAGASAMAETDIKKIVALSTLSQLGIMALSISLHAPYLAFFHLATHALTKSLLFFSAGAMISFNAGGQDIRNIKGTLWQNTPVASLGALVSSISLCGVPFSSGFFSKDLILETLWASNQSSISVLLMCLATALTTAYSIKFLKILTINPNESGALRPTYTSETALTSQPVQTLIMFVLPTGYLCSKSSLIFTAPLLLSSSAKLVNLFLLSLGYTLWEISNLKISTSPKKIHAMAHSLMFLESLSGQGMSKSASKTTDLTFKALDQGWIETLSVSSIKGILTPGTSLLMKASKSSGLMLMARSLTLTLLTLTLLLK